MSSTSQEDKTQNQIISFLEKRLDKIDASLEACATKRDLDRIIESYNRRIGELAKERDEEQEQIDNHCTRIRQDELNYAVLSSEVMPMKKLYNNLSAFLIGALIVIGGLVCGVVYWLRGKV